MNEDDGNVRSPTAAVQAVPASFTLNDLENLRRKEKELPMSSLHGIKTSAFDGNGRLLCFAAPLIVGFRGAPLALSVGKPVRRIKAQQRKNWAKRRAYGA
jgi:hypothetical protein